MAFLKGSFAVVTLLAATAICGADDKPRLGVSIIDTSNQAGVIVTKIGDDSPASRLSRVGGGDKLKLEPQKHAITHVNGRHVQTTDRFLKAIAESPKQCTLRIYEYSTADWADHKVQLRGKPTVAEKQTDGEPTRYWVDANGHVYSQDGQYQYTQQGSGANQYVQTDNRGERKSRKRFFNMFGQPEGDDWRPGDNIWLFQHKPQDPELRKAYDRQAFVEILTGVAAGLSGAADGLDSYQPYTPGGSSPHINTNRMQWDSFNRNYSTNPDHAPFINWAN